MSTSTLTRGIKGIAEVYPELPGVADSHQFLSDIYPNPKLAVQYARMELSRMPDWDQVRSEGDPEQLHIIVDTIADSTHGSYSLEQAFQFFGFHRSIETDDQMDLYEDLGIIGDHFQADFRDVCRDSETLTFDWIDGSYVLLYSRHSPR